MYIGLRVQYRCRRYCRRRLISMTNERVLVSYDIDQLDKYFFLPISGVSDCNVGARRGRVSTAPSERGLLSVPSYAELSRRVRRPIRGTPSNVRAPAERRTQTCIPAALGVERNSQRAEYTE